MSNVLSQNEIDELLKSMTAGEAAPPPDKPAEEMVQVRNYDFAQANKFSKEQMRTLNFVFESFSRLFATNLSATLRTVCEVEVLSVEELPTFYNYLSAIPSPVVIALLSMAPMHGPSLMEIAAPVAYAMINRLFGGSSTLLDTGKNFTEIELAIIERILRKLMPFINEAWERVTTINTTLDRIETNPQFAQIVAMNEAVAIITLNVKIGDAEGLVNLCIPHLAIEPIAKSLNTRAMFSGLSSQTASANYAPTIQQRLMNTQVTLQAVFNNTTATVRDIMSLQAGDVIRIDHDVNKPITIKVEHFPKFHGMIGTYGSKYATQVVEIIKEELDYE